MLQGGSAGLDLLAYSCGWGNEPLLDSARLILLVASLSALVEFGRASLIAIRGRGPGRWVLGALLGVALLGAPAGFPGLGAASRYALGLVGGLWAAGIFYWASKDDAPGDRALLGAAVAMGVFGLTMGLVTDPAPFLPASILNTETVRQLLGMPMQLVRGLAAVGICVCLALFARASLLSEEMDRRVRQWEVNLLRGAGAGLVILVVVGWFFTQYLGRRRPPGFKERPGAPGEDPRTNHGQQDGGNRSFGQRHGRLSRDQLLDGGPKPPEPAAGQLRPGPL